MPKAYQIVVKEAFPFGVLIGVSLPREKAPVPDGVLGRLRPAERVYAEGLAGHRQMTWTGGRIAMHKAIGALGLNVSDVLTGPYGEPLLPEQATGSISHKDGLVVALAARAGHGHIGVDLEELEHHRLAELGDWAPAAMRPFYSFSWGHAISSHPCSAQDERCIGREPC